MYKKLFTLVLLTTAAAASATAQDAPAPGADKTPPGAASPVYRQVFTLAKDGEPLIQCGSGIRAGQNNSDDPLPPDGLNCYLYIPLTNDTLDKEKPASCPLAWQPIFTLPPGGEVTIHWQCRGDSDFSGFGQVIADGETLNNPNWRCTRSGDSLSCTNKDGHGYTLGPDNQELY